MQDEGFHEIHLNGKQLVFTFMAGTVVSVVIFLCGVMVGRGIPASPVTLSTSSTPEIVVDPTASVQPRAVATATSGDGAPVSTKETLTYAERLEAPIPPPETLRTEPVAPAVSASASAPVKAPPAVETAATSSAFAEPAGKGFVVQVAAVFVRADAEAIARRLSGKGFPTFVTTINTPPKGVSYRVRVGKYNERQQAEAVAVRLRKEQFNTWITR